MQPLGGGERHLSLPWPARTAALPLDSSPFTRSIVMSTIGIIGAGAIGSAFAKALAGKGLEAIIANSRGPASLAEL
ncbi:NAD(P)-binding domain-containing protein, partial [Cupriavidus basilensis]